MVDYSVKQNAAWFGIQLESSQSGLKAKDGQR
jgi:hypothetical protein